MTTSKDAVYVQLGSDCDGKLNSSEQHLLSVVRRPPCDCDKKSAIHCRRTLTTILFVAMFLLAVALCGLIINLYVKTVNLEEKFEEAHEGGIQKRSLPPDTAGPELGPSDDQLTDQANAEQQQFEGAANVADPLEELPTNENGKDTDDDKASPSGTAVGMHLVGGSLHLTLRKGSNQSKLQNISIWDEKDRGSADPDVLTLTEHTAIEIRQDGLYSVHAQLSLRMKSGTATYRIDKYGDGKPSETLAQCVTNFPEKYATLESCYTSTVTWLHVGDLVVVSVYRSDLTIDFDEGKSFFGATLIQTKADASSEDRT